MFGAEAETIPAFECSNLDHESSNSISYNPVPDLTTSAIPPPLTVCTAPAAPITTDPKSVTVSFSRVYWNCDIYLLPIFNSFIKGGFYTSLLLLLDCE